MKLQLVMGLVHLFVWVRVRAATSRFFHFQNIKSLISCQARFSSSLVCAFFTSINHRTLFGNTYYVLIHKLPSLIQCDRRWYTSAQPSARSSPPQPFDMVCWRRLTRLEFHIGEPIWRCSTTGASFLLSVLLVFALNCSKLPLSYRFSLLPSSYVRGTLHISGLYRF